MGLEFVGAFGSFSILFLLPNREGIEKGSTRNDAFQDFLFCFFSSKATKGFLSSDLGLVVQAFLFLLDPAKKGS